MVCFAPTPPEPEGGIRFVPPLEPLLFVTNLSSLSFHPFFCRPAAQRAVRQQPRSVLVRRQPVARFRRDAHPKLPDQADADLVQAPPAADDEVVLCHQPEPGRQGPQAAGPEDGPLEAGAAGEVANNSVCQFYVY